MRKLFAILFIILITGFSFGLNKTDEKKVRDQLAVSLTNHTFETDLDESYDGIYPRIARYTFLPNGVLKAWYWDIHAFNPDVSDEYLGEGTWKIVSVVGKTVSDVKVTVKLTTKVSDSEKYPTNESWVFSEVDIGLSAVVRRLEYARWWVILKVRPKDE